MADVTLTGAGGLPIWPTTLAQSQSIPTGYRCDLNGTLTLVSVTLTIEGTGLLTISNDVLLQ